MFLLRRLDLQQLIPILYNDALNSTPDYRRPPYQGGLQRVKLLVRLDRDLG
jgi:hypothetical protein